MKTSKKFALSDGGSRIEPSRVVLVQTGFLGDAVLSSSMLRSLIPQAGESGCGLVVRAEFAELFAGHPAVGRIHPFNKRSPEGLQNLVQELRQGDYQLALLPHRSFRSARAVRRAGIPMRVGFRRSEGSILLTHRVDYQIAQHEVDRNRELLSAAGFSSEPNGGRPWLVVTDEELSQARKESDASRPLVLLAPGSVWATKQWTPQGYARLAVLLQERGGELRLIGSKGEKGLLEDVGRSAGLDPQRIHAGDLSLRELLALVATSAAVVANDSAPVHIAEAVGVPVVAIFGPTVPEFGFAPRGVGSSVVEVSGLACRPCSIHGEQNCPLGTHECMQRITPEMVLERLSALLPVP